jgi:hypothetical protein
MDPLHHHRHYNKQQDGTRTLAMDTGVINGPVRGAKKQ